MSFSRESRYRNLAEVESNPRGGRRVPPVLIGVVAVGLIGCCLCLGLLIGIQLSGAMPSIISSISSLGGPTVTPTPDLKSNVPLKKPGLVSNGLELTVAGIQRPLKVEGNVKLPSDQQFILVTVRVRNTKTSGAAIKVAASDFQATGDGGLVYGPNPKTVAIPQMLTEMSLAPGKSQEAELIFQIATDDANLQLQWKVGSATRVFLLE